MMSRHEGEQKQRASDALSVEQICGVLREPVPVRAEWRAGLLRDLAMVGTAPEQATQRWRLHPIAAVAAGLACALIGAGAATLVLGHARRVISPDAITSLTATMPLPEESAGLSTVRFVFVAPYASRVSLVGDFNAWNPSKMPMRRSSDGRAWLLDVPLPPGRHVYSFVVDGDLAADPAAPRAGDDDFGVPSSVVLVGART
jgi:AMP-activated protein kinase-like protein